MVPSYETGQVKSTASMSIPSSYGEEFVKPAFRTTSSHRHDKLTERAEVVPSSGTDIQAGKAVPPPDRTPRAGRGEELTFVFERLKTRYPPIGAL